MAPSQLKQLKASLHARRTGPKSSNKQQEQQPPHSKGFQKPNDRKTRDHDPKARADSLRRTTLLPALQNRHKVGGILDRRIGENDPTMSPEERMLQRYSKQRSKRGDAFNLEDGEGEEGLLTHGGRSLLEGQLDEFAGPNLGSDEEEDDFLQKRGKRRRSEEPDDVQAQAHLEPDRKKSKKEVMEEVIAKSKHHKYERQRAKEEDDDIRAKLDEGVGDLLAVLRGTKRPVQPTEPFEPPKSKGMTIHPDRMAQMNGETVSAPEVRPQPEAPPETHTEAEQEPVQLEALNSTIAEPLAMDVSENNKKRAEKEYDRRIRQMAMDQRAQPTERTKTAEEKAEEEAERLKRLEAKRLLRMRGERDDSESESEGEEDIGQEDADDNEVANEAAAFGLRDAAPRKERLVDVEDEDDFIIDEDLVASGSDIGSDFSDEAESDAREEEDDDADFLRDVMSEGPSSKANLASSTAKLPYTYPCPSSHEELLVILKDVPVSDLPLVIQRIRALYHPQLNAQNKEKLSSFAACLVIHLSYLGSRQAPLQILETLIRHIHSLARTYGDAIAEAFRLQLSHMQHRDDLTPGDLCILTAIGSIYPTSDHFHQVVTPAITIMARWLGMTKAMSMEDLKTGAYVVALCIKYQRLSKRYIPEAIRFTTGALKHFPEASLIQPHVQNLLGMASLWQSQAAFFEMFYPSAFKALKGTGDKKAVQHLRIALHQSILRRRPLELHHHRPLPIKSSIPKFEENFNPDKHYDPDRERAESNKLKKEYKREKKGAVRELRKDAEFLRREKLKEKKETDAEYEKKQRRLIAEIQGEEGKEKNDYERERRKRRGGR